MSDEELDELGAMEVCQDIFQRSGITQVLKVLFTTPIKCYCLKAFTHGHF